MLLSDLSGEYRLTSQCLWYAMFRLLLLIVSYEHSLPMSRLEVEKINFSCCFINSISFEPVQEIAY
jgi:hypothetical protein